MSGFIMLRALGRSALVTLILVSIIFGLWYYTLYTLIGLVFAWLAIMFYTDPPEDWDK